MDSPNIGIGSGSATCIACGNEVSHFVVAGAMEGAPRFCHPCAGARLITPLPDAVAALLEEAQADSCDLCARVDCPARKFVEFAKASGERWWGEHLKAAVDRLKNAEAVLAALVMSSPNGGSVNA